MLALAHLLYPYILPHWVSIHDSLESLPFVTLLTTLFRDKGIRVKNLDLMSGLIVVNLEEKLFTKKKLSASTIADQKDEPTVDIKSATKSEGSKLSSLNKKIDLFPEKVVLISSSVTDAYHFLLCMGIAFLHI